jgi:hypothetical protein
VHTPVRTDVATVRDVIGDVLASAVQDAAGVMLYDLAPAYSPMWHRNAPTPLRNPPPRRPPQPRYIPPPLPEGHVRVALDDDDYAGPQWADWAGEDDAYPARVFDVPAEQRERWAAANAAYFAMQEEISEMRSARMGRVPPGWVRKGKPYQVQP